MRVNQSGNNAVQGSDVNSARQTGKAGAAGDAKKKDKTQAGQAAHDPDSVKTDISSKGKEFAAAKAAASDAPDVREDRIAELKRRISAGKYHVDSDAVADRMVDEHLMSGIG